jgi:segregation and condensation protein A
MASGDIDQTQIWETYQTADRAEAEPALVVDVDGFEGPLDLLLSLARSQKVDLARISILALAEQYLAYIEQIRQLRLELAADYLVMAAWLAYLKSRLLLPEEKGDDEPTGEELANALAFRLRRLEAMRDAAAQLANSDRLERDVFGRGFPEPIVINKKNEYSATIYDLLSAYAAQRQQKAISIVQVKAR